MIHPRQIGENNMINALLLGIILIAAVMIALAVPYVIYREAKIDGRNDARFQERNKNKWKKILKNPIFVLFLLILFVLFVILMPSGVAMISLILIYFFVREYYKQKELKIMRIEKTK